ncbi:MAG: lipid II flippase MurJ, partial [Burkholderiaceae bacterium]|nr:lipid II flippase MurJ [Burkholderiaceae bacterium]
LVPRFAHAGLALAIGLGAMVNATWLLVGLVRRGMFKPLPGWGRFALQVGLASLALAAWLWWAAQQWDWTALGATYFKRIGLMALILSGSAAIYFAILAATGVKLRHFARRAR